MSDPSFVVRPMTRADVPAVAKLAAALVRLHHATDPRRFLLVPSVEEGYARFLGSEIEDGEVVLLTAVAPDGAVIGYAYGRMEGRDWNLLLDAHGALHDLYVADDTRARGVGGALVREACARLEAKGAPRVVLSTMVSNVAAQALFEKAGFRKTMIEMTRERPAK